MSFTGRLGTPNTQFGNIVFAAVDGLGPGTPDFQAHQLNSREVRVLFNVRVTEDALDETNYEILGLGPSTVPGVSSIRYFDESLKSVVVTFEAPLTTGAQYSVTVENVQTVAGEVILSATKNFTANVLDPPRAVGAFLSKRGSVDILFDKPVGPFSSGAVFDLRDADGGPLFGMIQTPWAGEDLPETTLRVELGMVPAADAYVIEFSGVTDFSLNTSAETVPLTLVLRSPPPYGAADLSQLQLVDAFVTDVSPDVLRTSNVRVFFSCPVLDATNLGNWDLRAEAGHAALDDLDALTAPPAVDLGTLAALLNDLKAKLNNHLVLEQVHFAPAGADTELLPDAATIVGSNTAAAVDTSTDFTLLVRTDEFPFLTVNVTSAPGTTKAQIKTDIDAAAIPGLVVTVDSSNRLVLTSTTGIVEVDSVANGSTLNSVVGYPVAGQLSGLAAAIDLVNDLAARLPSHFLRPRVHSWPDTVHAVDLGPVPPLDLPAALDVANDAAALFSAHILAEYPLEFSSEYGSPIGEVTAYALEDVPNGAFDVQGPYTYYADLRVLLESEVPAVVVRATLTSEDGGSSTNPADYTGMIVARPASAPATVRSSLVSVDSHVDLRLDRNVGLVSDDPLVVAGPEGREEPTRTEVLSTLPTLLWAFNNALEAYRRHIVPGAAGHQVNDDVNIVTTADFAYLPLPSVLSSVNQVRQKVMAHMASAIFHYHSDPSMVTAPEATDLESLAILVADLTSVMADHFTKVGPHLYPGYRMVSAPVFDVVRVFVDGMVDGYESRVSGGLQDMHVYNGVPRVPAPSLAVPVTHFVRVDWDFLALAVRPSVASALPRSALVIDEVEYQRYESDAVEVFFSKPMREVPLSSSNLPVTGGSIVQKDAAWSSPLVASVSVIKMDPITYSVVAVGLSDQAGNPVY